MKVALYIYVLFLLLLEWGCLTPQHYVPLESSKGAKVFDAGVGTSGVFARGVYNTSNQTYIGAGATSFFMFGPIYTAGILGGVNVPLNRKNLIGTPNVIDFQFGYNSGLFAFRTNKTYWFQSSYVVKRFVHSNSFAYALFFRGMLEPNASWLNNLKSRGYTYEFGSQLFINRDNINFCVNQSLGVTKHDKNSKHKNSDRILLSLPLRFYLSANISYNLFSKKK